MLSYFKSHFPISVLQQSFERSAQWLGCAEQPGRGPGPHPPPDMSPLWPWGLSAIGGPHLIGMAPRTGRVVGDRGREPGRATTAQAASVILGWASCGSAGGKEVCWAPICSHRYRWACLLSLKTTTTWFSTVETHILVRVHVYSEPMSAWGREPNVKAFAASGRAQQG